MYKKIEEAVAKTIGSIKADKDAGENGTFRVIANNGTVDRDGEIIDPDGADIENYMKNPILLRGHNYRDVDAVIGKVTKLERDGANWIAEGVFADTVKGQQVRKLYDDDIIKTVSIGFIGKERVYSKEGNPPTCIKWELLEISFVPVPSNPTALTSKGVDAILEADIHAFDDESIEIKVITSLFAKFMKEIQGVKEMLDDKGDREELKAQKRKLQDVSGIVSEILGNLKKD